MSNFYSIDAPAKLNLNLFITGINNEGLHLLKSHICFLELKDKILIKYNLNDEFYQLSKDKTFLIDPNKNLILNAIKLFREHTNWHEKFKIFLDKKIPIGAGLGGGSADAAATLIILRNLYNREKNINDKISKNFLFDLAIKLGSDVPACLKSRDLLLNGYGEKITNTKIPDTYYFLLINPYLHLSTKEVFNEYKSGIINEGLNPDIYFENIKIFNSLLNSAISLASPISHILLHLKNAPNIIASGMTGSGSTCFGIFKNVNEIKTFLKIFNQITNNSFFIWYGKKQNYSFNRVTVSKVLENKL
jgi:4-diphosphocytidyl-2-C-methyl-D-erythritol kinase